jgi:hypothetical protein
MTGKRTRLLQDNANYYRVGLNKTQDIAASIARTLLRHKANLALCHNKVRFLIFEDHAEL